ncbi:MAG: response regulator transcription factor, partial [Bdellovibrionales bacterium]|nr:response regulator transcription factor [Bdellovibrionales bacterium]
MNILIIEDDPKLQTFLSESLESDFSPIMVIGHLPLEDDEQINNFKPRTIILDRLLGKYDSKDFLPQLRKKFPESFIIILSAINNSSERSELLDLGADDYIGKPFSLVELKSRIRAITRRTRIVEQTN